jgi:hypothetical protein
MVVYMQSNPVSVWVNESNTRVVTFHQYGRYTSLRSDVNALDFALDFLFGNDMTLEKYLNSLEDTREIDIRMVA